MSSDALPVLCPSARVPPLPGVRTSAVCHGVCVCVEPAPVFLAALLERSFASVGAHVLCTVFSRSLDLLTGGGTLRLLTRGRAAGATLLQGTTSTASLVDPLLSGWFRIHSRINVPIHRKDF